MIIRQISDPFVQLETSQPALWLKVRPVLGRIKRKCFSWLEPKPSPPPPVLGYTGGASGPIHKRALLIYLLSAFPKTAEEIRRAPINTVQSLEIARALNRLGYIVDAVDWQDSAFVPQQHYDVCFGMHYNYGRLLPMLKSRKTINIYYATGAYWKFENEAEAARSDYLLKRRGIDIRLPERLIANNWVQDSDAIVALGDGFNEALYTPHNKRVFSIDHVAVPSSTPPNFEAKDFSGSVRQNFLCIVGTGLLHKGVDLVLEAFTGLPDCHLWLCGGLHPALEEEFLRAYRKELFYTPNIHPVGIVDRPALNHLSEMCVASVHASCSESQATSVLDTMVRGLVPLVTRESGVSTERFGMTFKDGTVEEIRRAVTEMANTSPAECRRMAEEAYQTAITRYTLDRYVHNIEEILRNILKDGSR